MHGAEESFLGTQRFSIHARLGDGGGGVVYQAHDRKLRRDVALKVLRDPEGEAASRFREAFESLRALHHPNLVKLYDLVETQGALLLSMELIHGVELLRYVRPNGDEFDEVRVRGAFAQIAQALRALHRERKVHRDVKSSNICVAPEGRVVLLDLDLAADLDAEPLREDDPEALPVGTALYMAPEQVTEQRARPSSDWYALGVVLYEALTGTVPYRGSDLEVLMAKQDARPLPPRAHVPHVPSDLDALCVDLLVPLPSERPSGAQVLRRLGVQDEGEAGRLSLASLLSGRSPFIGREPDLARLHAALERSRSGAVVVRVTGEPGVGKTTLCEELFERLSRDGRDVLAIASPCPRYPDRPHAPVQDAVMRVAEALRQGRSNVRLSISASALRLLERAFLGSVLGLAARQPGRSAPAPDPLEQRWRAIAALRSLFSEVSQHRPFVWWLDDYQWADVDTQRLIGSLVLGPDAPRMLLVLSEEPEPGLAQTSQPTASEVLMLEKLRPMEAKDLVSRLFERATGQARETDSVLWRDGTPLVVHERLRYALFFGEPPAESLGVSTLISRRIHELSPSVRRVLELVCASHDPIPQEVCERASGLSRADFTRHLSALRVGGLVRSLTSAGEDMLMPGHPLVADCIDLELHGEARVATHGRLAVALVARDPARASGRLLRHQGESGDHYAAAQSARVAAEQAHEALAFQRAAELFTLCASLDPPGQDEEGYRLLKRMADALAHAGWSLQAATIYREAALGAKAADALHMRQRAAEHLLRGAEIEEGLDAVRELLASIDLKLPATPSQAFWSIAARRTLLGMRGLGFREVQEGQVSARDLRRVDVLWASAMQLGLVDVMRGADFMARGLSEALKTGEPYRVARALCSEAWSTVGLDRADARRTRAILDSARELVERVGAPALDGHLRLSQGMVAHGMFRVAESYAHCRDAERVFRDNCEDAVWEVSTAQIYQVVALAQMARYDELVHKLTLSQREAEERGDVWGHSYFLSVGAMSVKLARDLPNEAAENVREAMARWASAGEFHYQHWFGLLASVHVELYRQSPAGLDLLETKWPELRRNMFLRVRFFRTTMRELRGRAAIVAARKRNDLGLLKMAEAQARSLLREREPAATGFGHLLLGNIAHARGDEHQARQELTLGITLLKPHGLDLPVQAAQRELGRMLGGDAGQALLSEAEGTFARCAVKDYDRFSAMLMPGFAQR